MVDVGELADRLALMEKWHSSVDDWRDLEIALFQAFIDKQDEVVALQREAVRADLSMQHDILRRITSTQRELQQIAELRRQAESDLIEARAHEENES